MELVFDECFYCPENQLEKTSPHGLQAAFSWSKQVLVLSQCFLYYTQAALFIPVLEVFSIFANLFFQSYYPDSLNANCETVWQCMIANIQFGYNSSIAFSLFLFYF